MLSIGNLMAQKTPVCLTGCPLWAIVVLVVCRKCYNIKYEVIDTPLSHGDASLKFFYFFMWWGGT
jgi:hypothetical protein